MSRTYSYCSSDVFITWWSTHTGQGTAATPQASEREKQSNNRSIEKGTTILSKK